jgi:phospholipid transport system substrate-binding protein
MYKATRGLLAVFLLLFFTTPSVFAITPAEQIQGTIQQVLSVVKNPANSDEQRRELVRETLMPMFDWVEMAKQTLGKSWAIAAGRENEFVTAFTNFLGNSYVGTIGAYKDEKILFIQESIEDNQAQVKTKIVPAKGEAMSVNYRMHRVQGEWKIYDVVVEDISLVVNYRSQFSRILAKGSFDELLKQMREKELRSRN